MGLLHLCHFQIKQLYINYMFKAVIAGYSRSPFTMAKKGELIDIKPVNMLAEVIKN